MAATAAQLRRLVRQASGREPEVAERPKRMETIIDKLVRQPTMALSRMHDIAGCRAVLRDQQTADALIDAIRTHPAWSVREKTWDYVAAPKPDGYRAKHLVVNIDGLNVEIQVRTMLQHAWAELVERLDRDLGLRTKFGESDPAVAASLQNASAAIAAYERGELDFTATISELIYSSILAYRVHEP